MNSNFRSQGFSDIYKRIGLQRGLAFGVIIISALLAFEIFNYSTTDYALGDLLGDLTFVGVRWSTILAIAFCGIDFAGIARLFTPEDGADEPTEVWYLFGAWLLAATMNAMLTWWGVSLAVLNHESLGNSVIARDMLLRAVPIFVAVLVWLIRVLIIGTFSVAGNRLFSQGERRVQYHASQGAARMLGQRTTIPAPAPAPPPSVAPRIPSPASAGFRPAPKSPAQVENSSSGYSRPEPTYHPVALSPNANNGRGSNQSRR